MVTHIVETREARRLQNEHAAEVARLEALRQQAQQDGDQDVEDAITEQIVTLPAPPADPDPPTKPVMEVTPSFTLPQVLLGSLFLTGMQLPAETVSNVVRNARGRTDLSEVIDFA